MLICDIYHTRSIAKKSECYRFTEEPVASSDVKSGTANNAELAG